MHLLEEIKALKTGKKELRDFGITFAVILGGIAGLLIWKERETYTYFAAGALFFLVSGFALQPILKPLYSIWMIFSIILGWVMTRVLLSVIFFLGLTPISFLSKLFGKKFMDMGPIKDAKSYWNKREASTFKKENYENQY